MVSVISTMLAIAHIAEALVDNAGRVALCALTFDQAPEPADSCSLTPLADSIVMMS